MAIVMS